ncbi:hypothetical protein HNQ77_000791 [Silvibacterium bohemicum]|uniref:AbiTii domain-containing protein n=1 Tax=Silvibacterium bohemicum TaxID=1577686 RepID=A0A841JNL8_9BACT|nr:hypothetical protein [Silvibacterium bohemicum]MBB6142853.1 hypothetical protein [Silvibacterium bohemicum]
MDRARVGEILSNLTALGTEAISTLKPDAQAINTAAHQVGLSWSGSALGHHAEMYFEHFQRPPRECRFNAEWGTQMGWPRGWFIPTVEEIEAEISRISGVDLAAWKERYEGMMLKLHELPGSLLVEIPTTAANLDPRFARIVSDIEASKFDDSHAKEYLRQQLNAHRPSISRDLRAISASGVTLPTHLCYEALVEGFEYTQKSLAALVKNIRLLARYIEVQGESNAIGSSSEAQTMLETLTNDPLMLRKSDGMARKFQGRITSGKLTTFESTLPYAEGDTVERELPNGQIENFEILELGFHQGLPPHIGPHYQMKIRKITDRIPHIAPPSSVTNIYNVHGPNARFNSQSVDQSHNVVRVDEGELFQKLKEAIQAASANSPQREQLLLAVEEMSAHAGRSSFGDKFQSFMALASNCMTVVTPFLPALANLAASVHH